MKKYIYAPALIILFAFNGCVQEVKQKEDAVNTANEINDNKKELKEDEDFEFVTETASHGMMEVQLAKTVMEKAQTKEAEMLAQHMVEDHSKANIELMTLAEKKKITLPETLSKEDKEIMNEVLSKKEIELDKEYAKQMAKAHKDAIDNFERAVKRCEDEDIKNFASSTLPVLRSHLQMAEETLEKIKDKKNKYD